MADMKCRTALAGVFVAAFLALVGAQPAQRFDLLIRNGRIMDGTGNPWFPADIGVLNGRIAAIGKLEWRPSRADDRCGGQVRGAWVHRTFFEPHQHSEGVDYVFINGTAVVDSGKLTHATPGKVLVR
jgi:N-acyl-D-amino-acid deacylase